MIAMKFSSASPLSSSASLLFLISCLMGSHVIMFNHCGSPLRSGWVTQPPLWLKCCLPALKWQDKELCGGLGNTHTHTLYVVCAWTYRHTHTHTTWAQTDAGHFSPVCLICRPSGSSPTVRKVVVYSNEKKKNLLDVKYKEQDNEQGKKNPHILSIRFSSWVPWQIFSEIQHFSNTESWDSLSEGGRHCALHNKN